jgi:isocitrate lyase
MFLRTQPSSTSGTDRWHDVQRLHSAEEVQRLAGTIRIRHTLAELGAERLWDLVQRGECRIAPGVGTPDEALQLVRAGCQILATAPEGLQHAPWSGRGASEVNAVARVQRALVDADRAAHLAGNRSVRWLAPLLVDLSVANCTPLEIVEAMRVRIEAGAAGVRIDDRAGCSSGGMGERLAVTSTGAFVRSISAARLAADVEGVPTVLIAVSSAARATHLTSDHDPRDAGFAVGTRDSWGMQPVQGGIAMAIARALEAAPFADIVCLQAAAPSLFEAEQFAQAIHARHPHKPLAYEVPAEVHWARHMSEEDLARFEQSLSELGYALHFLPRATFHARNAAAFDLATDLRLDGVGGWARLRAHELSNEDKGYGTVRERRDGADAWASAVRGAIEAA